MIDNFNSKDLSQIDINNNFFHYTNKNNLEGIFQEGLQPRIGDNSLYVEKSKKVFFAAGQIGILTIIDVWLKWLTAKKGTAKWFHQFGCFYMRIPFCIKFIPNLWVKRKLKSNKIRNKSYEEMKCILDESVFLILDLKENVDFSYNDIDEVKDTYYESFLKLLYPSESDLSNKKIEYWNMHTYSNKVIDSSKISLLKDNDEYSASKILKQLIDDNIQYVKQNLDFLYEYYNYFYN